MRSIEELSDLRIGRGVLPAEDLQNISYFNLSEERTPAGWRATIEGVLGVNIDRFADMADLRHYRLTINRNDQGARTMYLGLFDTTERFDGEEIVSSCYNIGMGASRSFYRLLHDRMRNTPLYLNGKDVRELLEMLPEKLPNTATKIKIGLDSLRTQL